jgi:DNA-binding NtrC family response regulator
LVERLSILCSGERIEADQARDVLSMSSDKQRVSNDGPLYQFGRSMRELLHDFERRIMLEAISAHGNSKTAAAQALGTERSHFYNTCRQYGLGDCEAS